MSAASKMQLKGRRPPPLAVRDESHKSQKPLRRAVVVYLVSPDVIHADASEFKALVQRLTGLSPLPAAAKSAGNPKQFPVRVKARGTRAPLPLVGTTPLSPSSPALPALFLHNLSPPCLWPGSPETEFRSVSEALADWDD